MHSHTTPRPNSGDPRAARIAALSEEYLDADAARKEEIGTEILMLIEGRVLPLPARN